jgi:hypothetical protein
MAEERWSVAAAYALFAESSPTFRPCRVKLSVYFSTLVRPYTIVTRERTV